MPHCIGRLTTPFVVERISCGVLVCTPSFAVPEGYYHCVSKEVALRISEKATMVLLVTAVLCAIISTGLMVRREFAGSDVGGIPRHESRQVDDWKKYASTGHVIGVPGAPVTITEFADFECPACAQFEKTLATVRGEFGDTVALVFRHWPLPYHHLAYSSARASECASAQGRFAEMHDLLFAKQDSLGLKSFGSYAQEAGVADSVAFRNCIGTSTASPAIERDEAAVKALGATGTPTVMVNGLLLGAIPDEAGLRVLVRSALKRGIR